MTNPRQFIRLTVFTLICSLCVPLCPFPFVMSAIEARSIYASSKTDRPDNFRIIDQELIISHDLTFPEHLTLKFLPGGKLNVIPGRTVTIEGFIEAGLDHIFPGEGLVSFKNRHLTKVYPQWWGAKSDWNGVTGTDNYGPIQKALNAFNTICIPNTGTYSISRVIDVPDNRLVFADHGKARIINTSVAPPVGWAGSDIYYCNVFQIGNYGGQNNLKNGVYAEASYDIQTINPPANAVQLVKKSDIANFKVGDIVFLSSREKKQVTSEIKYCQTNKVRAIEASQGKLLLELQVEDEYLSKFPNFAQIRRVSGNVTGLDGLPARVGQNVSLRNLQLENIKTGPNWSVVHASAYNLVIDHVELLSPGNGIGINPGANLTLKNIAITHGAIGFELCYLCNNVELENINITATNGQVGMNLGEEGCNINVKNVVINGSHKILGMLIDKQRVNVKQVCISNEHGSCLQISPDNETITIDNAELRSPPSKAGIIIGRYQKNINLDNIIISQCSIGINLANTGKLEQLSHLNGIIITNSDIMNYTNYGIIFGTKLNNVIIRNNKIGNKHCQPQNAIFYHADGHKHIEIKDNIICGAPL